ncbi:MAG: pyridoxal-phosphate dependent enzyme [Gemmatimonadetes bacterium]|nr:pyridoxal-phosphate dependent enzyme [Gemmatimonadota bacterium]MDA1102751.1 pyridoxal-phosphate dependent enzyme [Gemmatimonadota bacterium]
MKDIDALRRLEEWPRTHLANLPTPLIKADRLAGHLGIDALHIKMDAETGFALGGNKVRKLEFELEPNRMAGVTCLITAGGAQSNHCRVTAAFAARLGVRCILVTQGVEPAKPTGNALLHRLFGAEIVTVAERADRTPTMHRVAASIEAEGGRPMVLPIGASTGLGCLGYASAALELTQQLDALGDGSSETLLFGSTSSCGTMAGLVLGLALLGRPDVHVFGVSADAPSEELTAITLELAREGAALLGASPDLASVPLVTIDDQVGGGYGVPTVAASEATADFGRLEGVVLDPTYTAKAAAGMIDWISTHEVTRKQRVVFLHTGGHPGLLA